MLAEVKGISLQEVAQATSANFERLFLIRNEPVSTS
jgi:Tat protein secretion system quality control protein TatD with DNase activity